jgi:hypothetical protein
VRLTKRWTSEIFARWGIQTLTLSAAPEGALWVSRCAATKRVGRGTARNLYDSPLLEYFLRFVETNGIAYAVLSDRYGLHYPDERLARYDIHPSSLSTEERRQLGQLIRRKASGRGYDTVVFYNGSPVRSVPYFEMLAASGLTIWYTTRLHNAEPHSQSRKGL